MHGLTVTLVQSELHWENIEANLAMFSQKLAAVAASTDLILLPETFSTGFSMDSPELAETMDGKAVQWMRTQAATKKAVVAGSLIIKENGRYFNRFIWMRPDGTCATYDKRHLFAFAGEDANFTGGNDRLIVDLNGWKICPLVCYDLRFPVWSRQQKSDPYDLLLYVANWPSPRINAWDILLQARAIENQSYVIGLNRIGTDQKGMSYTGHSAAIDPKGSVISSLPPNENCTETVRLDWDSLADFRAKFPVANDADSFEIR